MFLTINYFAGTPAAYAKERQSVLEREPTASVTVEWHNIRGKHQNRLMSLPVPEWGVSALMVYNNKSWSAIGFIPDGTHRLRALVNSVSENIAERLTVKHKGIISMVVPPGERRNLPLIEKLPHVSVNVPLSEIVVAGPRMETGLLFTSRISFVFTG